MLAVLANGRGAGSAGNAGRGTGSAGHGPVTEEVHVNRTVVGRVGYNCDGVATLTSLSLKS